MVVVCQCYPENNLVRTFPTGQVAVDVASSTAADFSPSTSSSSSSIPSITGSLGPHTFGGWLIRCSSKKNHSMNCQLELWLQIIFGRWIFYRSMENMWYIIRNALKKCFWLEELINWYAVISTSESKPYPNFTECQVRLFIDYFNFLSDNSMPFVAHDCVSILERIILYRSTKDISNIDLWKDCISSYRYFY